MCFGMFSALTLTPHRLHLTQAAPEVGFMSSFMSSSTVKSLAFASSLTLLTVSIRTVSEYQPFSGMNIALLNVNIRLTGQLFNWPARTSEELRRLGLQSVDKKLDEIR